MFTSRLLQRRSTAHMPNRLKTALSCALIAGNLGHAWAGEPAATPYRPTVSNPAALPAPGYLEFEFGALNARGGEARRRNSLPVLAKYAFTENFGLLLGGEPRVALAGHDGEKLRGAGDTTLQLKFRHELDKDSALGLEAGIKADTAKTGIGSGKTDYLLNGIYSREIGDYALDANLGYTRLGVADTGESRNGYSWAASLGRPINDTWGAALELSGVARSGTRPSSQVLAALTYNVSRQVVLDGGMAFGLSDNAPNLALFFGMTVLFK